MITVQPPIEIQTKYGIVLITISAKGELDAGNVIIETFQRHGKRKYRLDTRILDGKLNEQKA